MPLNCWEFKKCGREPGGKNAGALGVCAAATETRCNGANCGANGGRACWLVSGTLCGGEVQGHFAQKLTTCKDCDFYKQVHEEEGAACQPESEILLSLSDPGQVVHAYEELRCMHAKLKATQAELVQARKLEAVGQLAAGIAHEINTPTQFIGDNLLFLKETLGPLMAALQASGQILNVTKATVEFMQEVNPGYDAEQISFVGEEIPKAIDQSLEGIRRVASIVRAIKDFALPGTSEKVPIDIHRAIENTIVIAGNEWKEVVEVHTDFDPSVGPVPCIPDDFNQVILSLLVNASQAIRNAANGAKGKGSIAIRTLQKHPWVEIHVSDTGPGIPQPLQHRIFDPFFTTKEVGKGTGQGLYLAYMSVVKKHGGTLSFECPPGQGTTFIVRLPAGELSPDKKNPLSPS